MCTTNRGDAQNGERRRSADDLTNLIVVYGTVVGADGATPWPDGAGIRVENTRTERQIAGVIGGVESGSYEITFIEFTSNDAAAVGDSLVFEIDSPRLLTPSSFVLTRPEIESRLARVDLRVLPVRVTVDPSAVAVDFGGTQQFTATITGTSNPAVTWSVDGPAENGMITEDGLYMAPGTALIPSTVTVRATSEVDLAQSGTAAVTLMPLIPPSRACCTADGGCELIPQYLCTGVWVANSAICSPSPCPQPGACCSGASCTVGPQSACQGEWLGEWTVCAPTNPCGPAGACCFPDQTCVVLSWKQCAGQGGQAFVGNDTVCEPSPCGAAGVGGSRLTIVTTLRFAPNPFGGATTLYLSGPPVAAARVLIFDAAGRLVCTAWEGSSDGRELAIAWDGRDQSGRPMPAGIYLVRVESAAGGALGRLVKME